MTRLRTITIAFGWLIVAVSGSAIAAGHPHAKHLQGHATAAPSRAKACAVAWPHYLQGLSGAAAGAGVQLSAAEVQQAHSGFMKKCMAEGPNSPQIVQVMQGSGRQSDVIDDILDVLP
jgi:hypothetical protein